MKNKLLFISSRGDIFFVPKKYIKDIIKSIHKLEEKEWTGNNMPSFVINVESEWYYLNMDKFGKTGELRLWGDGNGYLMANEYSDEDDTIGYPVRDGDIMKREIDLISLNGETKPCWIEVKKGELKCG